MRFYKVLIGVVIVAFIGGLFYKGYDEYRTSQLKDQTMNISGADTEIDGLEIGQRAPSFELETIDGKTVSLDDFKGQQVVLNFWASWCPPCREELPDLIEFSDETGIPVLGVNVTKNERRGVQDVETFLAEVPVSFPILLDTVGEVEKTYRVVALPTTYIVGENGKIKAKHVGPVDFDWLNMYTQ